jgi:hypothetical protein
MSLKLLATTIVLGLIALTLPQTANAKQIEVTDKLIVKTNDSLNQPEKVLVVPIFAPNSDFNATSDEWYKGLLYYSIERLGFSDIPFHYVVTELGDVYVGNEGGEETKLPISNNNNLILIGYLAQRSDNEINPRAYKGLGELILNIANRNAIKFDQVKAASISFRKSEERKTVTMQTGETFGLWNTSLGNVIKQVQNQYAPVSKNYAFEISNVKLPTTSVKLGDSPVVSIDVKNTSSTAIFQGSNSELYAVTRNNTKSKFFVNNLWAGPAEALIMDEGVAIRPGETKTLSFKLNVPLYFGEQSEQFVLKNGFGTVFNNTAFQVKLNVERPANKVVEILPTEIAYLRVRENQSTNSREIARLSAGERYIVLEDAQNGWLKLDIGGGKQGWVSRQYTKAV